VKEPASRGECDRTVVLPGQIHIDITASQTGTGRADLCAISDAASTSAVTTVAHSGIPRRTTSIPAWSWLHADACALLTPNALAQLPGVDALHPDVGFGNWECRWHSTTHHASLLVRFDRNQPLTASDGNPVTLAGRSAFIAPHGDGDPTCTASIVGRRFTDSNGEPAVELLLIFITGPQTTPQLCSQATAIARAAAPHLPQ
jgi:anti-sigma factor RsiW